ncbi:MAG: hypothetical protein P8J87_07580 [Verrucomicrobiales bacterium]|nr:hypothetical protein [Verrucomicrobiales bacterium]
MIAALRKFLVARFPNRGFTRVRLRAMFSRYRLPPGEWVALDELERSERCFLLEQAARVGPVFKALAWGEPWICVVGLSRGRRLLREHSEVLTPMTLHLQPLFPMGFLRQMKGETHRHYRKALGRAIRPEDLTACEAELGRLAAT